MEIAFRTVFIYLYTLILIRWIGSRSIAQLSLVEFLLVIALSSAVGDAMFYPDVPLVHGLIVITLVVLLDKGLAYIVARNPVLEDVIEGKSVEVVRDGVIAYRALKEWLMRRLFGVRAALLLLKNVEPPRRRLYDRPRKLIQRRGEPHSNR